MSNEKIKEVEKPKIPEQVKDTYRPQKEGMSSFDKILEQNKLNQMQPKVSKMDLNKASEENVRVVRNEEHREKGKEKDSDDKEQERGKQKAREDRKSSAGSEDKVIGKGQKKGHSGGSGSQGQSRQGKGFGGAFAKRADFSTKKGSNTKATQSQIENSKFAARLQNQLKTAHLSREFIQNIVNQVVKSVRLGLNKKGDQEIRLDLHERIFRGLQLRVALKNGKVSVHFNTSSSDVRELFEGSSEDIQKQLESKGVEVSEIKVT